MRDQGVGREWNFQAQETHESKPYSQADSKQSKDTEATGQNKKGRTQGMEELTGQGWNSVQGHWLLPRILSRGCEDLRA